MKTQNEQQAFWRFAVFWVAVGAWRACEVALWPVCGVNMGERGRPRKSIEELIASGAIYKNPKRYLNRLHELEAGPVKLKPPAHFMGKYQEAKREIWNDLVAEAGEEAQAGDKYFLEQVVCAVYDARFTTRPAVRKLAADLTREWDTRIRRRRDSGAGEGGVPGAFGEFA